MTETSTGQRWEQLRAPFPPEDMEKLPKTLRAKDDDRGTCTPGSKYSADGTYCGKYHARAVHLDYVGHAGITMRLNEVDQQWDWQPLALTAQGTPLMSDGGMWIKLTVLGVTHLGFGDAAGKNGPNAIKEMIGDAIRNAAMRFGVATYLWSKSTRAENLAEFTPPDPSELTADARARALEQQRRIRPDLQGDAARRFATDALAAIGTTLSSATAEQWDQITEIWSQLDTYRPPAAAPSATPPEVVEATAAVPMSQAGQWRMLGICFGNAGVTDDAERHYITTLVAGHPEPEANPITSSKDLTKAEAERVLKWLRHIKTREQLEAALNDITERSTTP